MSRSISLTCIDDVTWEVVQEGPMRVPGRIFANAELLHPICKDKAAEQVANVACLPGIVNYSFAMPDAHWGYGFPIGGVAATDPEQGGVISPGGVGYDINCGCRIMTTNLRVEDIRDKLHDIIAGLYRDIPCGMGSEGAIPKLSSSDMRKVLEQGAQWAVQQGYGSESDIETTEEEGCLAGAQASEVSERACKRGDNQLGTLGSGNHFAELGVVDTVLDEQAADVYGVHEGTVTLMIHSGSRGLGYQVCDDFLQVMQQAVQKYDITLPDRQLCCAPLHSEEGRRYWGAMAAAANYAWANRQIMMELARRSLCHSLHISPRELGGRLLYDVAHNIAKLETHDVNGVQKKLCVHRKGATRAFPGNRTEVPACYRAVGQPVLIPGNMGSASYICAGTQTALEKTFGSCCHGAGRMMSRSAAKKATNSTKLLRQLKADGIVVMARSKETLVEEAPEAYKDVDVVSNVVAEAGLGKRVVRLRPLGVVKG